MEMLSGAQIGAEKLADWRKLGQGLHARYEIDGLAAGARFLAAISEANDLANSHLEARVGRGCVDLKLISLDAVYTDGDGTDHTVEWVTQQDVDLAHQISGIAAQQGLAADPASIMAIELALDTADSSAVAPVWSALLTGGQEAKGRGTIGDDVRDGASRVPILWFQDTDPHPTPRQRFHVDIQVPYDVVVQRVAAAVAAGATIVDDSDAPGTTVLADPDGNRACIGTFEPAR